MMSILLSLALAAAATENPPANGTTTTQPAKPEKPKKICKTTKMTGSNLGKRVCKTQEQWDGAASEGAQSLDLINQNYKGSTGN